MWFEESVFYHIYPLGFCGALADTATADTAGNEYEGKGDGRILKIREWIPHMKKLGINALYLGPLFESDYHGYDTRDYQKVDSRLGTNEQFAQVCKELREHKIRIILDGVFNHVGRGFFAFQDVLKNREQSRYKEWFQIDFGGNSNYNDGLWYEGWEGHYELVKLNLHNEEVVQYLAESIRMWVEQFGIDGLRLDVAYMLDREFLKKLRCLTRELKKDFFLLGEMIHGEYRQIVNEEMTDSCTNYECYKGLYSSFNSANMYEIGYSLNRQFGPEQWTLYKGLHLMNFADNHDVNRLASVLEKKEQIPLLYGLMFGMPGIPCIYYGSEWGIEGDKAHGGDAVLRPAPELPQWNSITDSMQVLVQLHKQEKALIYGSYRQICLTNQQFVFAREYDDELIFVGINMDTQEQSLHLGDWQGRLLDLISQEEQLCTGTVILKGNSVAYWKAENRRL